MCGIAGIFDKIGHRPVSPEKLAALSSEIQHRGRDDVGYLTDSGCGLVHRRLSIIDPDGGKQPMQDDTGQIMLTFNGMIYNFKSLRQKLEFAGHHFHTNSDTEVLLKSYIAWGTDCVKYLDGFFAFAIYDKNQDLLFCSRDILGKKPFYYYIDDNSFFYFASELNALLEIADTKPPISISALQDYLTYGFIADPKTLFQGFYKLNAGHTLIVKRNNDNLCFSNFSNRILSQPPIETMVTDYSEAISHTESLLHKAIESRLIADVPVGTLLSGGLDSGLITAIASQKTKNITAFTASFNDKNLDEAEAAQSLAQHLGIEHRILKIEDIHESIIDDIAVIAGEPFADAAIIPLYLVCSQAAEQVKVLLSGDGGDELFAGYSRYPSFIKQEAFKSLLSLKSREFLFGALAKNYPQNLNVPRFLRAGATFEALATTTHSGYMRNISIARRAILKNILSDYAQQNLMGYDSAQALAPYFQNYDPKTRDVYPFARYADLKFWLASRMLPKADRASMTAGIELRCPLLDLSLTEYAQKIPYEFLAHPSGGKKILREIAQKYLPAAHLKRPKQGFVMPINQLLKTNWASRLEAVINDKSFSDTGLFDMRQLKILMFQHFKGQNDHSRILWAIIQLEAYLRNHKFI